MSAPRSQRGDTLDTSSSSSHYPTTPSRQNNNFYTHDGSSMSGNLPNPTYASFSPATLSSAAPSALSAAKRRSTILVHQKSPLLLATPPQITRSLAYSHPFLLPLNKLVGLLTWTTGDPWESFLMLVVFWASVLYGDIVLRLAGPVVLVLLLIGGMYGRRFSPLSSSGWSEPGLGTSEGVALAGGENAKVAKLNMKTSKSKNLSVDGLPVDKNGRAVTGTGGPGGSGGGHTRNQGSVSEITNTRHQKTLDEIVETLKEFTARCNILLEPLLELTDFLSTQRTPTSATTRPALTTLFVRILICTPFWFLLTLPPLRIITSRRVILLFGTIILSWHSRVMRVARAILWRSASIRRLMALLTGLSIEGPVKAIAADTSGQAQATTSEKPGFKTTFTSTVGKIKTKKPHESELTKALRRARGGQDTGVRFTFIIYENQRRWVGLGWTTSLFAYERPAWTDEHNNSVPQRDQFQLPEVEDGSNMRWRWVEGSRWRVDGVPDEAVMPEDPAKEWDYDGPGGRMGWVYYDNKWQNGRRGQDGWGRWTRRRKWYRDAELVEAEDGEEEPQQPQLTTATAGGANGSTVDQKNKKAGTPSITATSPPPPSLPPRPAADQLATAAEISRPRSETAAESLSRRLQLDNDAESIREEEGYDSASVLSTSSRSFRFKAPSFRRRVTDNNSIISTNATSTGANPTSGGSSSASGLTIQPSRESLRGHTGRGRRTSNATNVASSYEEDTAALGTQVGLAMQDAGKDGRSWGVGDEVRMGLE